jgi:hypothetical protein
MNTLWGIFEIVFGLLLLVGWGWCMIDWVRGGCRIPSQIHYIALGALIVGGIISGAIMWKGGLSPRVLLTGALLPAVAVYGLWLLCLGPWNDDGGK